MQNFKTKRFFKDSPQLSKEGASPKEKQDFVGIQVNTIPGAKKEPNNFTDNIKKLKNIQEDDGRLETERSLLEEEKEEKK